MKVFFQLTYRVESKEEELSGAEGGSGSELSEDEEVLSRQIVTLSCIGVGYSNFSKTIN